jgi:hypothetical protein
MPQLRPLVTVGAFIFIGLCSACGFWRSAPLKRDILVGNYVYRSVGGPPIHDPDRLTLKADGKYILVHMPGGRTGPVEEGTWELYNNPSSPTYGSYPLVALGTNSYPVEVKGKHVRLLIDLDLGYWYEKTK